MHPTRFTRRAAGARRPTPVGHARLCAALLLALLAVLAPGGATPARAQAPSGSPGAAAPREGLLVVAGATGRTGVHVVEHALRKGYRVRVLARRPEAARERFGDRVEVAVADVRDAASLGPAVAGATWLIASLGSSQGRDPTYSPDEVDYQGTRRLVEAAKAAGVRHVVLITAMGVTQPDHPLNRASRNVLLWKALGENSLRFSGLDYTIVRPGALLDGPGGASLSVSQGDAFRDWDRPRNELPAMDRADLALVTVEALGRPELRARTFEVTAGQTRGPVDWDRLFAGLKPDRGPPPPRPAIVASPRCAECAPLAQVPPGRFDMGSSGKETVEQGADARRVANERPVHAVRIERGFGLGIREVTRGEFARFVAETRRDVSGCSNWENDGWAFHPELNWRNPGFAQTDEHPVVCVSWNDAQAYIAWLNARTGERYRLPTEAEWEYAARAGATGQHHWTDDAAACRHANGADFAAATADGLPRRAGVIFECDDGFAHTAPAGRFPPNAFGLHDMLGNVWEWVADCYAPGYEGAPTDGSARTGGDCGNRVLRGGSWKYPARTVRFAIRGPGLPDARNNNAGFRLASDRG
jgi:formylglycine-generating enzyme required for sulfatase activity